LLKNTFTEEELAIYSELLVIGVTGDAERTNSLFQSLGSKAAYFKARGDMFLRSVKDKCPVQ
jgi:hypothetical protein